MYAPYINAIVGIAASLLVTVLISVGYFCAVRRKRSAHFRRQCPIVCYSFTNIFGNTISRAITSCFGVINFLRLRNVLLALVLTSIAVFAYQFGDDYLRIADDCWEDFLYPSITGIVQPLLIVVRFVYTALVPLYNLITAVLFQIFQGTPLLIANCEIDGLYKPLRHAANSTILSARSVATFFSDTTKPFNGTEGIQQGLLAVADLQLGLQCVCTDLRPLFDIFFHGFRLPAFAYAINHLVNVPISLVQDISTAIQTHRTPTFAATMDHVYGTAIDTAVGLDQWALHALTDINIVGADFLTEKYLPKEFVFAGVTRAAVGAVSLVQIPISASLQLREVTSLDERRALYDFSPAFVQLDLAARNAGESVYFVVESLTDFAVEHEPYSCQWSLQDTTRVSLHPSIGIGCAIEHAGKAAAGTLHLLLATIVDLSTQANDGDALKTLQLRDGVWQERNALLDCAYRSDHAYKAGVSSQYDTYTDYTVSRDNCQCVDGRGDYDESKAYSPWCGRITLQVVLSHADTAAIFGGQVLAGPDSHRVYAYPRLFFEFTRVLSRTILSVPEMVQGNWAYAPINSRYGTTQTLLGSYDTSSSVCENNANSDCMCNYAKAIQPSDKCQCIAYYPELIHNYESYFGDFDPLEGKMSRLCNSMYLEHVWSLLLQTSNTLTYLADWVSEQMHANSANPTCDHYEIVAEHMFSHHKDTKETANAQVCEVWGQTDSFCALGAYFKAQGRASVNIYRQVTGDIIRVITGDIDSLQLSVAPRICDYERELGMLSSGVANVLFFADAQKREALSKLGFAALDFIYVAPMKTASRVYEAVVEAVQLSAQRGRFDVRLVEQTLKSTIVDGIKIGLDNVHLSLQAGGEFFDTLGSGTPKPGAIFRTVDKSITQVEGVLTNAAVDLVAEISEIIAGFLSLLSGGEFPGGVVGLLKRVSKIAVDLAELLAEDFMLYINIVFNLLGSFGGVLKTMTTDVCGVVKDIMSIGIIEVIVGKPSFKCFDNGRRLAVQGHDDTHVAEWARTHLQWSGDTICDKFIRNNDIPHHEMRVLEQATFEECLQNRLLGEQISAAIAIPELKLHDVVYNWQRKYVVAYSLLQNIAVTRKAESRAHAYNLIADARLDTALHMQLYDWRNIGIAKFSNEFSHVISVYAAEQNVTASTLNDLARIAHDVLSVWDDEASALSSGLQELKVHINSMESGRRLMNAFTGAESKFKIASQKLKTVVAGAPINAGISECDGQSCLHCTILDNLIDVTVNNANAIASFYSERFPILMKDVENYGSDVVSFAEHLGGQEAARATYSGPTTLNMGSITRSEHLKEDWNRIFFSVQNKWQQNDTQYVIDSVAKFATTVNSSYVDLFGYGAPYALLWPIFESCDERAMIFVDETYANTQHHDERISQISNALTYNVIYSIAIMYQDTWSPLPLGALASIIPLAMGNFYIYAYSVYGYLPTCAPSLPATLMEDVWDYTVRNSVKKNLCELYPELVNSTCGSATRNNYMRCDSVNINFRSASAGDIGTWWWPMLTFTRHHIPQLSFVADYIPFVQDEMLQNELTKLRRGIELEPIEIECLNVNWAAVPVSGIVVIALGYFATRLALPLLFSLINFIVSFYMLYEIVVHMLEEFLSTEDEPEEIANDKKDDNTMKAPAIEDKKLANDTENIEMESAPLLIPLNHESGLRQRAKVLLK